MNMALQDDFFRDIEQYSELVTSVDDSFVPEQPKTIQEYNARMKANRTASVFDTDFNLNDDDDDDGVTYVYSGRGRGGRNMYFRPGATAGLSGLHASNIDEDLRREIRQVSGLGYSNELIQASIKATQARSEPLKNGFGSVPELKLLPSPSSSRSGSSCSRNTPAERYELLNTSSSRSTPCEPITDLNNSLITAEESCSNPISVDTPPFQRAPLSEETPKLNDEHIHNYKEQGAIPKKPTLPLSVLMKQTRPNQNGVRNKIAQPNTENKEKTNNKLPKSLSYEHTNGHASKDISPRHKDNNNNSSNGSNNSFEDCPPWRRPSNSPPRFFTGWGRMKAKNEALNINSFEEFPALK